MHAYTEISDHKIEYYDAQRFRILIRPHRAVLVEQLLGGPRSDEKLQAKLRVLQHALELGVLALGALAQENGLGREIRVGKDWQNTGQGTHGVGGAT